MLKSRLSLNKQISKIKRRIDQRKKQAPWKHLYQPHPKQLAFHKLTAKIGILRGAMAVERRMAAQKKHVCVLTGIIRTERLKRKNTT